jgi:hypothetical protein
MGISPVTLGALSPLPGVAGLPAYSSVPTAPVAGDDGSNDSSGFLSGLGDLFSGVGTAVASGLKAANTPQNNATSGWVYNPATGTYINPITGQALTATGSLTSAGLSSLNLLGGNSSLLVLLVLGIIAIFAFRNRG